MTIKSPTGDILVEASEGVVTVTLNRPDKLNSLTPAMIYGFDEICRQVSENDDIKALIITGAGRAFCSGAAVDGLVLGLIDRVRKDNEAKVPRRVWTAPLGSQLLSLYNCTKPTIAAVNGICGGWALSMAAACDIRIASEAARFGSFWVGVGAPLDGGATYLLPRLIGLDKALEFFYTNDIIDANEALRIGLVTRVVPHAQLMKASTDLALKIAKGPSVAIELGRRGMRDGLHNTLQTQINYETYAAAFTEITDDFAEGVQAFLEKRPPQFKGR